MSKFKSPLNWSLSTYFLMHSRNSLPSKPGRQALPAVTFILAMLCIGRNMRILSSTPRYAFMPSNSSCRQYQMSLDFR